MSEKECQEKLIDALRVLPNEIMRSNRSTSTWQNIMQTYDPHNSPACAYAPPNWLIKYYFISITVSRHPMRCCAGFAGTWKTGSLMGRKGQTICCPVHDRSGALVGFRISGTLSDKDKAAVDREVASSPKRKGLGFLKGFRRQDIRSLKLED